MANPASDFVFDDGSGAIVDYIGTSVDVVIPDKIGNIDVVQINANSFYNKGITSVTIPHTVSAVEAGSFVSNNLSVITILSENIDFQMVGLQDPFDSSFSGCIIRSKSIDSPPVVEFLISSYGYTWEPIPSIPNQLMFNFGGEFKEIATKEYVDSLVGSGEFVKSVQSGFIQSFTSGMSTFYEIPINQVNASKSIILVDFTPVQGRYDASSFIIDFASNSSIFLDREVGTAANYVYLTWWVIEFEDTVNVQKGIYTDAYLGTGTNVISIPIQKVDIEKSMCIMQTRASAAQSSTGYSYHSKRMYFDSDELLKAEHYNVSYRRVVWRVVEFP